MPPSVLNTGKICAVYLARAARAQWCRVEDRPRGFTIGITGILYSKRDAERKI